MDGGPRQLIFFPRKRYDVQCFVLNKKGETALVAPLKKAPLFLMGFLGVDESKPLFGKWLGITKHPGLHPGVFNPTFCSTFRFGLGDVVKWSVKGVFF